MEVGTGRTLARHDAGWSITSGAPRRDGWWRSPRAPARWPRCGPSAFMPDGWRDAASHAARDLIERGDDARFVAVACPALESALREMFAAVNDAPEVLVARLGEYYATMDGFGQSRVHDVILHPWRAPIDPARPDADDRTLPSSTFGCEKRPRGPVHARQGTRAGAGSARFGVPRPGPGRGGGWGGAGGMGRASGSSS